MTGAIDTSQGAAALCGNILQIDTETPYLQAVIHDLEALRAAFCDNAQPANFCQAAEVLMAPDGHLELR